MTVRVFAFGVFGAAFLGMSALAFTGSSAAGLGMFAFFMGVLNLTVCTLAIEAKEPTV